MKGPTVELAAVSRWFGTALAVDAASATFSPGAIVAVIGENGAGKSTLLKMAAGALAPSSGEVRIDGRALEPASTAEAIRRGVGLVYQHFMLCGSFRAIENLVLGAEPVTSFGRIDEAKARARAEAIVARVGLDVPLDAPTDALTVGERQRLEILRVLYREARAVLLDEPTAVLSPLEARDLYATLRRLADEGHTIGIVTHRLDEVVEHADRVVVMRRGKVVMSREGKGTFDAAELTRAIMGGDPPPPFEKPSFEADSEALFTVEALAVTDASGRVTLAGVDLDVRAGEIVGVAGVEGNGQRELVRAIAGLVDGASGRVRVAGLDLHGDASQRRAVLGVVHEDRHVDGLILDATVGDNLILGELGGAIDEARAVARRIVGFDIRPPDAASRAADLSGGNQQKIVIARAMDRIPEGARAALVLAQPTRGVDVGAAAGIHQAIGAAAARGLAVLIVSADLAELKKLCHRLIVMHRGKVVAEFPPDADDAAIGRAMLGAA